MLSKPNLGEYRQGFPNRLRDALAVAPAALSLSADAVVAALNDRQYSALLDASASSSEASTIVQAVRAAVRAQTLSVQGLPDQAEDILRNTLASVSGDPTAELIIGDELAWFLFHVRHDRQQAERMFEQVAALAEHVPDSPMQVRALRRRWLCLEWAGRDEEALAAAGQAVASAERCGELRLCALTLRDRATTLNKLGRHDDAIELARNAEALAIEAGDRRTQASSLRIVAWSLFQLGRYLDAIAVADAARLLALEADNPRGEAVALRYKALALGRLGRHEEAAVAADHAAKLAADIGDAREQAVALYESARALAKLGHHERAVAAADEAARLTSVSGEALLRTQALATAAESLNALGRPAEAWDRAVEGFYLAADSASATLGWCFRIASDVANRLPRPECLAMYERWLACYRLSGVKADPRIRFDEFMAATTRAGNWDDVAAFLAREGGWIREKPEAALTVGAGRVMADIGHEQGPAAAAEVARRFLRVMADAFGDEKEQVTKVPWLYAFGIGVAQACHDPKLLRAIAGSMKETLSPAGRQMATLLRHLASYDSLSEKGQVICSTILEWLRPSLMVWIRLMRPVPASSP